MWVRAVDGVRPWAGSEEWVLVAAVVRGVELGKARGEWMGGREDDREGSGVGWEEAILRVWVR